MAPTVSRAVSGEHIIGIPSITSSHLWLVVSNSSRKVLVYLQEVLAVEVNFYKTYPGPVWPSCF